MFKLVVIAALIALAYAAPKPAFITSPLVAGPAYSHSSIVSHHAPLLHTPVLHASVLHAPVLHAPLVRTVGLGLHAPLVSPVVHHSLPLAHSVHYF